MFSEFRCMLRNSAANVAIALALAAIPIFGLAGGVVDYSRVLNIKAEAQAAADAGSLAGAKMHDSDRSTLNKQVEQYVKSNFKLAEHVRGLQIKTEREATGAVKVNVSGKMKTSFLHLIGMSNMNFSVEAKAAENFSYTDVYLLMDRSASQLIADGDAAVKELMAATKPYLQAYGGTFASWEPEGCAFACHKPSDAVSEPWQPAGQSMLQFAEANNIPIRSRRVEKAASQLVDEVATGSSEGTVRFAVFDFASNSLLSQAPTADIEVAKSAIRTTNPAIDMTWTHLPEALSNASALIGPNGNASSQTSPRKYAVLITDGLHTWWDSAAGTEHYDPFEAKFCDALKANGITVAVINTVYDELPFSLRYYYYAKPNISQTASELKKCASPGLYAQANQPGEIEAAFGEIANKLKSQALRLLN